MAVLYKSWSDKKSKRWRKYKHTQKKWRVNLMYDLTKLKTDGVIGDGNLQWVKLLSSVWFFLEFRNCLVRGCLYFKILSNVRNRRKDLNITGLVRIRFITPMRSFFLFESETGGPKLRDRSSDTCHCRGVKSHKYNVEFRM